VGEQGKRVCTGEKNDSMRLRSVGKGKTPENCGRMSTSGKEIRSDRFDRIISGRAVLSGND